MTDIYSPIPQTDLYPGKYEGQRLLPHELVVGQDKSYREAAAMLGKSEGALRVQMYRCIREARGLLEKKAGEV